MGGLTRVGTAKQFRETKLLGTNRDGRINFTSLFSAGHKQKWRPDPVDAQPASYQVDVMVDNLNKFPSKCFDVFSLCPGCVQIFL